MIQQQEPREYEVKLRYIETDSGTYDSYEPKEVVLANSPREAELLAIDKLEIEYDNGVAVVEADCINEEGIN